MTDELKPCPFCRMPMQHRFALHVSDGNTDDIIHAEPTDCGLQFFSVNSADQGKTVVAAWNERSTQPTPPDSERMIGSLSVDIELALKEMGFLIGESNAIKLAELAVTTLRQRAEASDELLRKVFLHGHAEGWTGNQSRRDVQYVDAEKSWELYVSNGALEKTKAALEQST